MIQENQISKTRSCKGAQIAAFVQLLKNLPIFEEKGGAAERVRPASQAERLARTGERCAACDAAGQAKKSARGMPWHQEPKKDVTSCDKSGGAAHRL